MDHFYFSWFALVLFVFGFISSALVENVAFFGFLKVFPRWFLGWTLKFVGAGRGFLAMFAFIAIFNSFAILFYMMSGAFPILPFLIAFATGLNIGVIMQEPQVETGGPKHPLHNGRPGAVTFIGIGLVPILELAVFCFAVGMGMSMSLSLFPNYSPVLLAVQLGPRVVAYIVLGVPVLLLSAALEAATIMGLRKGGK